MCIVVVCAVAARLAGGGRDRRAGGQRILDPYHALRFTELVSQPAPFHARVARPSVERAAQQFGLSATAVARVKEIVAEIAEDGGVPTRVASRRRRAVKAKRRG